MPNQLYRSNLSIASPAEIERTARELRKIREGFLTTGTLTKYAPRTMILGSWQSCYTMHVNPSRRCAPLAIAREAQLYHLRESNELLIRATRSVMDRLTDFLAHSGYVIVLSDARGCRRRIFRSPITSSRQTLASLSTITYPQTARKSVRRSITERVARMSNSFDSRR